MVNGYSEDTFSPDELITREQMAVMITNGKNLKVAGNPDHFVDSDTISGWAADAVAAANAAGIISGYPDGTFKPLSEATRAEAVVMLVRAL
jgi:hypothetical protein